MMPLILLFSCLLALAIFQFYHSWKYVLDENDCRHSALIYADFFERLGFDVAFVRSFYANDEFHISLKLKVWRFWIPFEPLTFLPTPAKITLFWKKFEGAEEISRPEAEELATRRLNS